MMSTEPERDLGNQADSPESLNGGEATDERWPVGFILTIVMVSLYVGYRLVQLTVRFFEWLF